MKDFQEDIPNQSRCWQEERPTQKTRPLSRRCNQGETTQRRLFSSNFFSFLLLIYTKIVETQGVITGPASVPAPGEQWFPAKQDGIVKGQIWSWHLLVVGPLTDTRIGGLPDLTTERFGKSEPGGRAWKNGAWFNVQCGITMRSLADSNGERPAFYITLHICAFFLLPSGEFQVTLQVGKQWCVWIDHISPSSPVSPQDRNRSVQKMLGTRICSTFIAAHSVSVRGKIQAQVPRFLLSKPTTTRRADGESIINARENRETAKQTDSKKKIQRKNRGKNGIKTMT